MKTVNRRFRFAVLIIGALLVAGTALHARKIPVDQVRVTTPVYTPELADFNPPKGLYGYSVSWNGIPAGSIELKVERDGPNYKITADARTAKGIDILYKLRYHSEAVLSADTLLPRESTYISHENSRRKITRLNFLPNGEIQSVREDRHGKIESMRFQADNFTLDPYSAGFLALSLEWKVGDTRRFDTFTGKSRYLIELTATERTRIVVNGKTREAFVIVPNITKLTESEPEKKMRGAKIYISADNSREILEIVSDLFFGSVKTKMDSFTAHSAAATPTP